jgi:transposase
LREWLPEDHLALFIVDVVQHLDLSEVHAFYEQRDRRGRAGYHPTMMVSLLVYAYCVGKVSSRKIEKATHEDVAFRVLSGNQHPDHDSISSFRQRHLSALAALFVQVLRLCEKAGLVKLGHISIDGSKFQANASKHKAMSYERMHAKEKELKEEVTRLLAEAQRIDAEEDILYGKGVGDELPEELKRRESRLRKIEEAKAALEAEAKENAEQEGLEIEKRREAIARREAEAGKRFGGRPPAAKNPDPKPLPKAQRNFTDPESRIMPSGSHKGSFLQAYNCQIAVDGEAQIIVAYDVVQQTNDKEQLIPMAEKVIENCGHLASVTSADTGYFSEKAVTADTLKTTNLLVPPNRKQQEQSRSGDTKEKYPQTSAAEVMRKKLDTAEGKKLYRMRKAIVEPVFGQIKEIRGYRRFIFRGLNLAKQEFALISITHNLLKLFRSGKHSLRQDCCISA